MLEHLIDLRRIGYYAAPASACVTPARIPEQVECVEILTAGKIFFEIDGIEREFTRGAVFWHISEEHTIWKTVPEAPYCCVVFTFTVNKRIRNVPRVTYWHHPEEAAVFAEMGLKLFHAGIENLPAYTAYAYSTLWWNAARQGRRTPWPNALQTAIDLIREHWQEPLDVADLAELCHVSKPYLFALFREHLNTSPHQYILKHRINRAKLMLANGETSIKEIAQSCGFGSLEVFYRQFRKTVAISPHEYRKSAMPYGFRQN